MNDIKRKQLFNQAFALIEKINRLLLEARAAHERDAGLKKAA